MIKRLYFIFDMVHCTCTMMYHVVPNSTGTETKKKEKILLIIRIMVSFWVLPFPGLFVCWCGWFVLWGVLWAFPGRLIRGRVSYGLRDSGAAWAFCGAVVDGFDKYYKNRVKKFFLVGKYSPGGKGLAKFKA